MKEIVNPPDYRHDTVLPLPPEVKANAWAVDAGCSGNPGKMEYQGVDLATGERIFHFGPVFGTNNIGEFLAIVHALALMWQRGIQDKVIYSDSYNAILWVRKSSVRRILSTVRRRPVSMRSSPVQRTGSGPMPLIHPSYSGTHVSGGTSQLISEGRNNSKSK